MAEFVQYLPGGVQAGGGPDARGDRPVGEHLRDRDQPLGRDQGIGAGGMVVCGDLAVSKPAFVRREDGRDQASPGPDDLGVAADRVRAADRSRTACAHPDLPALAPVPKILLRTPEGGVTWAGSGLFGGGGLGSRVGSQFAVGDDEDVDAERTRRVDNPSQDRPTADNRPPAALSGPDYDLGDLVFAGEADQSPGRIVVVYLAPMGTEVSGQRSQPVDRPVVPRRAGIADDDVDHVEFRLGPEGQARRAP